MKGEEARISITNALGNSLYEETLNTQQTLDGNVRIPTSGFAKGLYLYKVETAGETYSGTLVK